MIDNYSDFLAFRYKGQQFLALEAKGGQSVHIFGRGIVNYGAYMSVKSFKKFYDRDGESLRLT